MPPRALLAPPAAAARARSTSSHADDAIGERTFAELRGELTDRDLVELCMLAGHYRMLAGLINSLRIEPDVHR